MGSVRSGVNESGGGARVSRLKGAGVQGSLSRSLLPHQNPRRESSVPHTYYLAEDGPA